MARKLRQTNTRMARRRGDGSLACTAARPKANAVFVLSEVGEPARILGYYTLCAMALSQGDVPEAARRHIPRYPLVSATLIGRLAVAKDRQGRGLGGIFWPTPYSGRSTAPPRWDPRWWRSTRWTNRRPASTPRMGSFGCPTCSWAQRHSGSSVLRGQGWQPDGPPRHNLPGARSCRWCAMCSSSSFAARRSDPNVSEAWTAARIDAAVRRPASIALALRALNTMRLSPKARPRAFMNSTVREQVRPARGPMSSPASHGPTDSHNC